MSQPTQMITTAETKTIKYDEPNIKQNNKTCLTDEPTDAGAEAAADPADLGPSHM